MRKNILSLTLAGALAATSIAPTTASANNNDDLGKILFGALAVIAVGKIIHDHRDRNRPAAQPTQQPQQSQVQPRRAWFVPKHCLRTHATTQGNKRLVGKRCLTRNYSFNHVLPGNCFRKYAIGQNRFRRGYAPACLRRAGFVLR